MRIDIADPRAPSVPGTAAVAPLVDLAAGSLAAPSAHGAAVLDRALAAALVAHLTAGQSGLVADAMAAAPSVAIARALWRGLIDAWALASRPAGGAGVAAAPFALPLVVVAGTEARPRGRGP